MPNAVVFSGRGDIFSQAEQTSSSRHDECPMLSHTTNATSGFPRLPAAAPFDQRGTRHCIPPYHLGAPYHRGSLPPGAPHHRGFPPCSAETEEKGLQRQDAQGRLDGGAGSKANRRRCGGMCSRDVFDGCAEIVPSPCKSEGSHCVYFSYRPFFSSSPASV